VSLRDREIRVTRRQAGTAVVVVVALFVAAYLVAVPARNYLTQQSDTAAAEAELEAIEEEIDQLEGQVGALSDPTELERLAREEFHLVYPGEEAFAVLPAPPPPLPIPVGWPFDALRGVPLGTDLDGG
jgi:cell division protein FtsB